MVEAIGRGPSYNMGGRQVGAHSRSPILAIAKSAAEISARPIRPLARSDLSC